MTLSASRLGNSQPLAVSMPSYVRGLECSLPDEMFEPLIGRSLGPPVLRPVPVNLQSHPVLHLDLRDGVVIIGEFELSASPSPEPPERRLASYEIVRRATSKYWTINGFMNDLSPENVFRDGTAEEKLSAGTDSVSQLGTTISGVAKFVGPAVGLLGTAVVTPTAHSHGPDRRNALALLDAWIEADATVDADETELRHVQEGLDTARRSNRKLFP